MCAMMCRPPEGTLRDPVEDGTASIETVEAEDAVEAAIPPAVQAALDATEAATSPATRVHDRHGRLIFEYDPHSQSSQAYANMVGWMLKRLYSKEMA